MEISRDPNLHLFPESVRRWSRGHAVCWCCELQVAQPIPGKKASVLDALVSPCARRCCPKGDDSSWFNRPNSNCTNSSQLAAKSQGVHRGGGWIKRAGFQWVGFDLKRTTCFSCQIRRLLLILFFQGLKSSVLAPVPYIIHYFPSTAVGLSIHKSSSAVWQQGERWWQSRVRSVVSGEHQDGEHPSQRARSRAKSAVADVPLLISVGLSVLVRTEQYHRRSPATPFSSSCVLQHPLQLSFLWMTQ